MTDTLKQRETPTIDKVVIEWLGDESPDLSYLGEYTSKYAEHYICAHGEHQGEFCGDVPSNELPTGGRQHAYFAPYAGGEKPGSEHYNANAKQDFERMDACERGLWAPVGCVAKAELSYPCGGAGADSRRLESLSSGGLWGIESDMDKDYRKQVEDEQLEDLASHLGAMCGIEISAEELREKSED